MENSKLSIKERVMQIYVRKFSMGKKCTLCGGKVQNLAKILTCPPCRAKNKPKRKQRFI